MGANVPEELQENSEWMFRVVNRSVAARVSARRWQRICRP